MHEPLFHELTLQCSIEHAYQTFTDRVNLWWPLGHRRFDSSTFYFDTNVGGELLEITAAGDRFVWANTLSADQPRAITLAWHPGKKYHPTTTKISFEAIGPHETHISLEHSEGEADLGADWSTRAALFSRGWTAVLRALHDFIKTEGI